MLYHKQNYKNLLDKNYHPILSIINGKIDRSKLNFIFFNRVDSTLIKNQKDISKLDISKLFVFDPNFLIILSYKDESKQELTGYLDVKNLKMESGVGALLVQSICLTLLT